MMRNIYFFGRPVPYNDKELGIYEAIVDNSLLVNYHICDLKILENRAKEMPKEKFIETIERTHNLAVKQLNLGPHPLINQSLPYKQIRAVENTRDFTAEILKALSGE